MAKQNQSTVRAAHYTRNGTNEDGSGRSEYAKKVAAGHQMYGDGKSGCAHRIKLAGHPNV